MSLKKIVAGAAFLLLWAGAGAAQEREYLVIVGSSTVYPFAKSVAGRFADNGRFLPPVITSTGSGGGFRLFCEGVGGLFPDITNASRRMKKSEFDSCREHGVQDIVEIKIGYDGIVLATSRKFPPLHLSRRDIFLALAKSVPAPDGKEELVPNPYTTWRDVNPALPALAIRVLGPPPTSGTRDAFEEMVMESGARSIGWLNALKKKNKQEFRSIARAIREDGAYVESGEDDRLIVQRLSGSDSLVGIFGFSFLAGNTDIIQGSFIDGVRPTFDSIASGAYPVSRPLFFYVKKAHAGAVPGIREYLDRFTSEAAWGPGGYLAGEGLIPLTGPERETYRAAAKKMKILHL